MAELKITNRNFNDEVLQSEKPVLIDFLGTVVRTMSDDGSDY